MQQKILFAHSYFLRFDPKQWALSQPYAPLGTLFAAAVMREQGHEVSFFDTMFVHNPEEISAKLDECAPDIFVIYDDGFNYLTKMCLTNMREAAFTMSKIAKQKGCKVIVSSSDATDHFEQYLEAGADFIIIGEGEISLQELVTAIGSASEDYTGIHGLAFQQNGYIVKTLKRNVLTDLDSLPLPAWDLVNIEPYREMWMRSSGYFSINIATTRGCPFKCNWCAKPIYGNRYNSRSPQQVVKEIRLLKEKFNFNHIWFCDDIFGLKPGWVQTFADLVEAENLHFSFKIQSRADLLIQDNYVNALARAGCDNAWMGAESGSQKILDAMDKGITLAQIETATVLLKQHKIKPSFFIQFGYLGETKEDIDKTIRMINRLLPFSIGISVSYPLPGTHFYEKVKASMHEKTNWTDSNELALMFANTYQPDFYKQLHRYVHLSYRTHLSLFHIKNLFQYPLKTGFTVLKKAVSIVYYFPSAGLARYRLNKLAKI